jgi:hypothetical protein
MKITTASAKMKVIGFFLHALIFCFVNIIEKSDKKILFTVAILVEDQLSPFFTCFCQIISILFSTSFILKLY